VIAAEEHPGRSQGGDGHAVSQISVRATVHNDEVNIYIYRIFSYLQAEDDSIALANPI
jgi:hypothetical protein